MGLLVIASVIGPIWIAPKLFPALPTPDPFIEEVSEANSRFSEALDEEYSSRGSAEARYEELKSAHRKNLREIHERHNKHFPGD